MGAMRTAIGLIVLLGLLIAIAAVVLRRRRSDEIHSIDNYRHALDTLQEMRTHGGSTSIRVLGEDEAKTLRQPTPHPEIRSGTPERPVRIGAPPNAPDDLVFSEEVATREAGTAESGPRDDKRSSWAMDRMQSRPGAQNRQLVVAGIAIAVVVVLVIVGTLIGRSSSTPSASSTTHPSRSSGSTSTTKPKSTTTTTPPATTLPKTLSPQNATATSASYFIPAASYSVVITANAGPCWTTASTGSAGKQVFAGSVAPGSPQTIKGSATTIISLGAPANVAVAVNGIPVTFPSGYQTPLVLTIQTGSALAPPSSSSSTTTTTTVAVTTSTRLP